MILPDQHETAFAGERQLREALEPQGWTLNPTARDYGIDFDVEVFANRMSTGIWIKVQLKSSASSAYSADGSFVSQPLDVPHARYLAAEIRVPVILVHADVKARRTFWCAPQLPGVVPTLDGRSDESSVSVRMPTAHALPDTLEQLVGTIALIETLLATRVIVDVSNATFARATERSPDGEKLVKGLHTKGDIAKLSYAHALLGRRAWTEAKRYTTNIVEDSESSVEAKFDALIILEAADTRLLIKAGSSDQERNERQLAIALDLCRISKQGPGALKLFAILARVAAELEVLTHRDWGLYLGWIVQQKRGDAYALAMLSSLRARTARSVGAKLRQAMRLVNLAASSPHRWAQPRALVRFVHAMRFLTERMGAEGARHTRETLLDLCFQICKISAAIGEESGDETAIALSAVTALTLVHSEDGPYATWALDVRARLRDAESGRAFDELLERWRRRVKGEQFEGDIETTSKQIQENIASGVGVNLTSANDPLAGRVRAAIADADPTRVLRDCQHSFVSIGQPAPLAGLLALPTLGTKVIHCTKHRYSVEAASLDDAYSQFKGQFCNNCPDVARRALEWTYSDEWQQAENAKHATLVEEWRNGQ